MDKLEHARSRLESFLAEIARVAESEFPTPHAREALNLLAERFKTTLSQLNQLDGENQPGIATQKCALALEELFTYLPLVGFILRSTNVRNAFEEFRPLLRLARDVLEPDVDEGDRTTQLILSSEWDYSPLTYPKVPHLPDFVLIGFPAPESSNPFLIPLAGHELGHSVWAKNAMTDQVRPNAKAELIAVCRTRWSQFQNIFPHLRNVPSADLNNDMLALAACYSPLPWLLRQSEETFCDFIGIRIFGPGYLQAFAYLLSPKVGARSVYYPGMKTRIENQIQAAAAYSVVVPDGYQEMFEDNPLPAGLIAEDTLRVSVADEALRNLVPFLIGLAGDVAEKANCPQSSPEETARICERLKRVVPAERCKTIADLLNAAWREAADRQLWCDIPQIEDRKAEILKELVLKNLEVFEFEQIQADQRDTES